MASGAAAGGGDPIALAFLALAIIGAIWLVVDGLR